MNQPNEKKRFLIVIPVAVITTAGIFIGVNLNKSLRISDNLEAGKECYNNMEYQQAVDYFNDVLDDDDKNVEAYYFKVNSLMAENNYDDATAAVEFGYKMTHSEILGELKDNIIQKPADNPVADSQPVVSNVISDSIYDNTQVTVEFTVPQESIFNNETVNLNPDVNIPAYIPPVTHKSDSADTDKNNIDSDDFSKSDNADGKNNNLPQDIPETSESIPPQITEPVQTDLTDSSETDYSVTDVPADTSESISEDTSQSSLINIDGVISDEEYRIYENLLEKIIDKIFDMIEQREKNK